MHKFSKLLGAAAIAGSAAFAMSSANAWWGGGGPWSGLGENIVVNNTLLSDPILDNFQPVDLFLRLRKKNKKIRSNLGWLSHYLHYLFYAGEGSERSIFYVG